MNSLPLSVLVGSLLFGCTFDASTRVADGGETVGTALEPVGASTQSDTLGGGGGGGFGPVDCPSGSVLIGLDGDFYEAPDQGAGFCEVKAVCAKLLVSDTTVTRSAIEFVPSGPALGDCGEHRQPLEAMICPGNGVVVGIAAVRSGLYQAITELELRCGNVDGSGFIFNRAYSDVWGNTIGMSGSRRSTDCTDPGVATGIYGGLGIVIDALGLQCQSLAPEN